MKTPSRPEPDTDFDIAGPRPEELFESLRAFGYDLPTAIADVIDNSIAAEAKNVWVDFVWKSPSPPRIIIRDDGKGMDEEQLIQAMRPGSRNPRDPRDAKDLGRFGLGMKTASISQCRCLTVLSHAANRPLSVKRWDLDYIAQHGNGEWRLLRGEKLLGKADLSLLDNQKSGTILFWDRLDHIVAASSDSDELEEQHFREKIDLVRDHLAMTFHRFLGGRQRLTLILNGRPLTPWDPFLEDENATQSLEQEIHRAGGIAVAIKPFILPHHSKVTPEVHSSSAGPKGWNAHQGFYIYRNKRLLVAGDWLGLGMQKEEHYKLARIRIDLPNTADLAWQIDVKKSTATPPNALRRDLLRIARTARNRAANIYRHRGKIISRTHGDQQDFLWQHKLLHGKTFYKLNKSHALLKKVMASTEDKAALKALLSLIEQTVPAPLIVINNAEAPDSLGMPFADSPGGVEKVMAEVYQAFLEEGSSSKEAGKRLVRSEPFQHFPEILAAFLENVAHPDAT